MSPDIVMYELNIACGFHIMLYSSFNRYGYLIIFSMIYFIKYTCKFKYMFYSYMSNIFCSWRQRHVSHKCNIKPDGKLTDYVQIALLNSV